MNMPTATPDTGLEGLNFNEVLRECLGRAAVVIDHQKKLVGLNRAAEELLGMQASDMLGRSVEVLPRSLGEIISATFANDLPQEREITLPAGERGDLAIYISTSVVQRATGGDRQVVMILSDMTSAKSLEQHLRHLDCLASIGTLSVSMAHEIKNAFVPVKTFLELLVEQNKGADLGDVVSRELKRIDSILSQMMRYAGPAKPTFAPLHLHDLLRHCFRLIEPQLTAKRIRLKKSLAAVPDLIKGDSYQLEQALLNLLFNAIEAMEPEAELSVATEPPAPSAQAVTNGAGVARQANLCLKIRDTGIGIPPENISRLFEPFFTTKTKGVGLGLSITRRIVQEHSGTISVESELQHGTTFTIFLPRAGSGG